MPCSSHGFLLTGRDDRPTITSSKPVTVSRETTFERNLHAVRDKAALGEIFTKLCEQVAADLQRKGYAGKTVGIKLRDDHMNLPQLNAKRCSWGFSLHRPARQDVAT